MKVSVNGRVVDAVLERDPTGVRWLVIGGIRLRATAAAAQAIRLREATAEEWAALRLAGFVALWERRPAAAGVAGDDQRSEEATDAKE